MPHDNKAFRLLRFLFFHSGSYPKIKKECIDFLDIVESAFYNYRNELISIGFKLRQKDGKYRVEAYLKKEKPEMVSFLNKHVEFELNLRARNLLVEEYPLAEKYIAESTKNYFCFKAAVAKYEGSGRFVLGMAEDIRLVGDYGFRAYLKEKFYILSF